MARTTKLERARQSVREQRAWMEHCGGDLAGYVARYGDSSADPYKPVAEGGRYGMGGQAIFEADMEALRQYEAEVARLERRRGTQFVLGV